MMSDPVWMVAAALGALGLAALLVWRMVRRRRSRPLRDLMRRLESFDPDERVSAGAGVVELGLTHRSAKPLAKHLAHEEDGSVRLGIAMAVERQDGVRSGRRRVRRLQRWAVEELVAHAHPVHTSLEGDQAKKRARILRRTPAPQS
jgi:MYXO-CTERM domain-containing protein